MTPTEQHTFDETPATGPKPHATGLPTLELPPAPFASRNDSASPSFIPSTTPISPAALATGHAAPTNPYLPPAIAPVTAGSTAPAWQHHVDGALPELRVSARGHVETIPMQPKSYASPWMAHPQGALDPRPTDTPAPRREHVLEPLPSVMPVLPEIGPNGIVQAATPTLEPQPAGPFDGITPVSIAASPAAEPASAQASTPTPAPAPAPATVAVAAAPIASALSGDPLLDIFSDQHAITNALSNPHMWYANSATATPTPAPALAPQPAVEPVAEPAVTVSAPVDAPMQWNGNETVAVASAAPAPFVGIEPMTRPAFVQPPQPAANPDVPQNAHSGAPARPAAPSPSRTPVARNPEILDIEYPGSVIIWNAALVVMGLGLIATPLLLSVDAMALLAQVAFGAATLGLLVTLAMVAHAAITAPPHLGGPIERLQSRMGLVVAAAAAHLAAANFVVGDQTIFGQILEMLRRHDVNSLLATIPMLAAVLPLPLLAAAWFATRNRRPASALLLVTATFLLVFSTVAMRLT